MEEISNEYELYSAFNTCVDMEKMRTPGEWNSDLGDLLPYATANLLGCTLRIFTSNAERSVFTISAVKPRQNANMDIMNPSHLSIPGHEHYAPCVGETSVINLTIPVMSDNDCSTATDHESQSVNISEVNCVGENVECAFCPPDNSKRKADKSQDRKTQKKLRNAGLSYVGHRGQYVPARYVKPVNCETCQFKCSAKISSEMQASLCNHFWSLGSHEERTHFILKHVDESEITSCRGLKSKRSVYRHYSLPVDKTNIRVCKNMFLATLCVGKKTVEYNLQKRKGRQIPLQDQRGRSKSTCAASDDDIAFINSHIDSFPRVESHYCRKSSGREYLGIDLNISKMYNLYRGKCQDSQRHPLCMSVYRAQFKKFNLAFHKPKKDQCSACFAYDLKVKAKSANEDDHLKHAHHINIKTVSREEKAKDKANAQAEISKLTAVCTFDLQKVLETPSAEASPLYYKRKLSLYNLTVFDLVSKDTYCMLWDETNGARGSCEIFSCLEKYIETLPATVSNVILFSDACAGQNKNQFLTCALHNILQSQKSCLLQIHQKYLQSGHTQMEVYSVHATIERAAKGSSIFVPRDWVNVIALARKKNPYTVLPMSHGDMKDVKGFTKSMKYNLKVFTNGEKVQWRKIKSIKLSCNTFVVEVWYDLRTEPFLLDLKMKRATKRNSDVSDATPAFVPFAGKYKERRLISSAKKADLLDLCRTGIIPEEHHSFYEALPSAD